MSALDDRDDRDTTLPESAMGGASDAGAHGRHPVSPELRQEGRSPLPGQAPGDAPIERRRRADPDYRGPERRMGPGPRPA